MSSLPPAVARTLTAYGIDLGKWLEVYGVEGQWQGAECGCVDVRCLGLHHDAGERCPCLPAQIESFLKDEGPAETQGP